MLRFLTIIIEKVLNVCIWLDIWNNSCVYILVFFLVFTTKKTQRIKDEQKTGAIKFTLKEKD